MRVAHHRLGLLPWIATQFFDIGFQIIGDAVKVGTKSGRQLCSLGAQNCSVISVFAKTLASDSAKNRIASAFLATFGQCRRARQNFCCFIGVDINQTALGLTALIFIAGVIAADKGTLTQEAVATGICQRRTASSTSSKISYGDGPDATAAIKTTRASVVLNR